jgi:hypothetical protein
VIFPYVKLQLDSPCHCCSRLERMAVIGMNVPVLQLLLKEGWMCCSGHVRMAALGMMRHAVKQQKQVT